MSVRSARVVGVAGAALVAASLVGGAVSVRTGVNTWSNAWSSAATLAAPWPMVLVQTAATVAAVSPRRRPAMVGAALLGLTAAVSGISGFFDGQLGRSDLGPEYVAAQVGYVVVAWCAVAGAVIRLVALRRFRLSQA
jgi:hypothetical protein